MRRSTTLVTCCKAFNSALFSINNRIVNPFLHKGSGPASATQTASRLSISRVIIPTIADHVAIPDHETRYEPLAVTDQLREKYLISRTYCNELASRRGFSLSNDSDISMLPDSVATLFGQHEFAKLGCVGQAWLFGFTRSASFLDETILIRICFFELNLSE
ncbi:MAG: hypothetical protein ACFCUR_08225 [Rhodomicrobiaceae bacterium]